ncbi:MAG: DUF3786 domain-containing protein [Nitrospirae bacterium]|nr:DUF3786 domain-containing protein [Nitrospirota bacterium]
MNQIELYKKLPKKNCGRCSLKACMPFAIAVIKGDAEISECPLLTEEEMNTLKGSITPSDWREELIIKLGEDVRRLKFGEIAEGLGATIRDGALVIACMGREFSISPDGKVLSAGRMTPWMKILLLQYIKTGGKERLTGAWASYHDLKGGMVKASSFLRECEDPLRELLDRDLKGVAAILARMGAEMQGGFPTTHAWRLYLLPKFPVVILYWPEEEDFPSKVKILFDSTADTFLDVESIMFLVEGLVKNIEFAGERGKGV